MQLHRRDFQRCSHYIVVLCHGQAVEVPVRDASGARVSEGQLVKLLVSAEAAAKVFLFYPLLFALSAQVGDPVLCDSQHLEIFVLCADSLYRSIYRTSFPTTAIAHMSHISASILT